MMGVFNISEGGGVNIRGKDCRGFGSLTILESLDFGFRV